MIDPSDYIVRPIKLPATIRACVRLSEDGYGNIYVNEDLSPDAQRKAVEHELNHLERDDFYNDLSIREVES